MLFQCPIVTLFALYSVIFYGYLLIMLATVGTVFQDVYGFTPGESGLAYLGMAIGFLIGQFILGPFSDGYVSRMKAKHQGEGKPEHRLPPLLLGATMIPIGFAWYGWSVQQHTHWMVPILGSALVAVGIMYTYLPVQMYLVDVYTTFAASAIGANTIVRSICGGLLPLGVNPLYDRLGYGWGNTLLALVALAFLPMTALLLRYGERIRTNPRFQPNL